MSLEFVTIGQRARPDDQPEVRTPEEETPKQPVDIKPIYPKDKGPLNKPRRGTEKLEHKLGEREGKVTIENLLQKDSAVSGGKQENWARSTMDRSDVVSWNWSFSSSKRPGDVNQHVRS